MMNPEADNSHASGQQSDGEYITSEGDGPIAFHGDGRWTFERGVMPGEPFGFLDVVDGEFDSAVAAIREIQAPGKNSYFEVADRQGLLLSTGETATQAAQFAMSVLAEVDARLLALPRLQQTAGAPYTLGLVATSALMGVPDDDAKGVNWTQVHQDVFDKAVGQDQQPVATVLDAIKLHSPGAVTPQQIAAVEAMGGSRKMVMNSLVGAALTVVQAPVELEMPKERPYTQAILECWKRIGCYHFNMPIETYPWGGRSEHIARRIVVSNYIEPDDVLKAVWVEEQAKQVDADWRAKEPGMSYISSLLRERSGDRWHQEITELVLKLPTVMGYMDQEWGEATRQQLASERRDRMHIAENPQPSTAVAKDGDEGYVAVGKRHGIFFEPDPRGRLGGPNNVKLYDLIDNEDVVKSGIIGDYNALVELGAYLKAKGLYAPDRQQRLGVDIDAANAAADFNIELCDSVETLSDIASEHGVRTLTDLMHLQNAILTGGFIEAYESSSNVTQVVESLPSAARWMENVAVFDADENLLKAALHPKGGMHAYEPIPAAGAVVAPEGIPNDRGLPIPKSTPPMPAIKRPRVDNDGPGL